MDFLSRLKMSIQRFMSGRYGIDKMNYCIIWTILILSIISLVFRFRIFSIIQFVLLILFALRFLSKDYSKRRLENEKFEKVFNPFWRKCLGLKKQYVDDRNYKYFKCPSCGIKVKVPRGKGKISIRCPKCKIDFIKKT